MMGDYTGMGSLVYGRMRFFCFFLFLLKYFGTFWDILSITGLVMFVANFLYRSVAHLILCCSKLH